MVNGPEDDPRTTQKDGLCYKYRFMYENWFLLCREMKKSLSVDLSHPNHSFLNVNDMEINCTFSISHGHCTRPT